MNLRILAATLLAVPALALAQAETRPAAAPEAEKPAARKGAAKPAAAAPVATVNGVAIPASRADFMMQQQGQRGVPDNEQTRRMVRDELVNRELIAQEAQKSGIAKSPEVQNQLDLARQEIVVGAYIRDWVRKNPISEADIQKEYDRAKGQTGDKEYKARHILVETEEQAKNLIGELKKGGKFEDLAAKNSKDPGSKDRGGDLDWAVPATYEKSFSDAMVKLDKGRFTDTPVRTRYGYHIIQLDDVRAVKFPPLAEVKPRIQQQLVQNRIEELVRGLRSKAKIQ